MLAAGHKSAMLLTIHKASFMVFLAVFTPHVIAYLPRVARSLRTAWGRAGRDAVPGSGLRAMLAAAATGAGAALALSLLGAIKSWHS
jgi:hypothetical protein